MNTLFKDLFSDACVCLVIVVQLFCTLFYELKCFGSLTLDFPLLHKVEN